MRISGFLVALLCGLVSVCGASDQLRQSSSPQSAVTSSDSDWLDSASGIVRPDSSGLAGSDRPDRDHRTFDWARDNDLTCYTIESYLVKRQRRGSDVVEPVGHSTCQRAAKYTVKTTEEPNKAPAY
jgi:hypothetical protein